MSLFSTSKKINKNKYSDLSLQGNLTCFVDSIYDGDTIHVLIPIHTNYYDFTIDETNNITVTTQITNNNVSIYKINVRLYGIDTPELKPPINTKDRDNIIKKAIAAKKYLESLILHKKVIINFIGKDKYGRQLGKIKINNDDVSDLMIKNGHAYEYFGGTKQK